MVWRQQTIVWLDQAFRRCRFAGLQSAFLLCCFVLTAKLSASPIKYVRRSGNIIRRQALRSAL